MCVSTKAARLVQEPPNMPRIAHICLWKLKSDAPRAAIRKMDRFIATFRSTIPGIEEVWSGDLSAFPHSPKIIDTFGAGPDDGPEARGFNHMAFMIFRSRKDRHDYEDAPAHMALGDHLNPLLACGSDGIMSMNVVLPA
jgi:hypothetical protein